MTEPPRSRLRMAVTSADREAVERAAERSHAPARGRHRGPGFRADITVLPVRSGKAEPSRGVYCHRCTNVVGAV